MKPKYCFWSVCDGAYGAMMEHCVRTARESGVFKEFHVLCNRPLEGCECYDAYKVDNTDGLFKLHYLKAGMTRLNFEHFIWIDADTVFVRNSIDILRPLGKSPIHVPLEANLSLVPEGRTWKGVDVSRLRELLRQEGIMNEIHACQSAFWIVHHDAIETVYDLAFGFWHKAKGAGLAVEVSAALGYAMQILCADPEPHLLVNHPDIWASDDDGYFGDSPPEGKAWPWRHPLRTDAIEIRPSMIHLPRSKELWAGRRTQQTSRDTSAFTEDQHQQVLATRQ